MKIELVAVEDAATREAARDLIAEYLRWIASVAAASYGLSFDIDAMRFSWSCASDQSASQAMIPAGSHELGAINATRARRNGLETLVGEMPPRVRADPNGRLA